MVRDYCYVLRLENGCYYVGYTCDIISRLTYHFMGIGSKWTRKNKPLEVMLVLEGKSDREYLHIHDETSKDNLMNRYDNNKIIDDNDLKLIDYFGKPIGDSVLPFEQLLTMDLILNYSISKVRGSYWVSVDLKPSDKLKILLKLREDTLVRNKFKIDFDSAKNTSFDYIKEHIKKMKEVHSNIIKEKATYLFGKEFNLDEKKESTTYSKCHCYGGKNK